MEREALTPGRMARIVRWIISATNAQDVVRSVMSCDDWLVIVDENSAYIQHPPQWDHRVGDMVRPRVHYELVGGELYVTGDDDELRDVVYVGEMFDGPRRTGTPTFGSDYHGKAF